MKLKEIPLPSVGCTHVRVVSAELGLLDRAEKYGRIQQQRPKLEQFVSR